MHSDSGFAASLDASILARAQRGERAAFEAIYRRYQRAGYALALRMLGRPAAAEDVLHDTFLRAFERIGSYRGEAPFGAWLKRMLVNLSIDRLRGEQRWGGDDEALEHLPGAAGADPDPHSEALGLLARLPPRARSVVWLHEMEGYSHAEIGALFGQSESWSKSLLARSLARLRESLGLEATT